jgi:hypothetical protein
MNLSIKVLPLRNSIVIIIDFFFRRENDFFLHFMLYGFCGKKYISQHEHTELKFLANAERFNHQ